MSVLVIINEGEALSPAWKKALPEDAIIREATPKGVGMALDHLEPSSVLIVLPGQRAVRNGGIAELVTSGVASALAGTNVAYVDSAKDMPIVSTSAPIYFFNSEHVHHAGGIDTSLSAQGIGMDIMYRLNRRGEKVTCTVSQQLSTYSLAPITDYLDVVSRNMAIEEQMAELAPLYLGLVSVPLEGTDTDALDLQLSPGSDDDEFLSISPQALDGARTLHMWSASFGEARTAFELNETMARIPDGDLAGRDPFIQEMWDASGITPEKSCDLHSLFHVSRETERRCVIAVSSTDTQSVERVMQIGEHAQASIVVWDVATRRVLTPENGELVETSIETQELVNETLLILVGTQARQVPWIAHYKGMVVADMTTVDLISDIRLDPTGFGADFLGPRSTMWGETFSRADRIVVSDSEQRDLYLGFIAGLGRLNPMAYDEDHSYSNLVAVENGVEQIESVLSQPRKSLDTVKSVELFETTPYGELAKRKLSFTDGVKSLGSAAAGVMKKVIQK